MLMPMPLQVEIMIDGCAAFSARRWWISLLLHSSPTRQRGTHDMVSMHATGLLAQLLRMPTKT